MLEAHPGARIKEWNIIILHNEIISKEIRESIRYEHNEQKEVNHVKKNLDCNDFVQDEIFQILVPKRI